MTDCVTFNCFTCFKVLRFFDTAKIQLYSNSFLSMNGNAMYWIGLLCCTPISKQEIQENKFIERKLQSSKHYSMQLEVLKQLVYSTL